jgi:hypothetical protein
MRSSRTPRAILASLLALGTIACGDKADEDDDTADNDPSDVEGSMDDTGGTDGWGNPCDDTPATLAMGDASPLGFSADEMLAVAAGPNTADAIWTETSGTTTATLSLAAAGAPVFHDLEFVSDTGDHGGADWDEDSACPDYLEVPVTMTFSTGDGAFSESISASLTAASLASLSAGADLDHAALGGSYTVTEIDPSEWDEFSLSVANRWSDGAVSGAVSMSASRSLDNGMGEGMVGDVLRWPAGVDGGTDTASGDDDDER